MKCHGCSADALIVYRLVPYQAVTLFDATPREIASCAKHLTAAKAIGKVLSATPLGDGVVTRVIAP